MKTLEIKTIELKNHFTLEEWVGIKLHFADITNEKSEGNPMLTIDSPTGNECFTFDSKEEAVKFFKDCLKILGWND